jgi:signal peptidase I
VTVGRLLMHVGWTLAFPGAGQGAAGKRGLAVGWAVGALVAALAITWTIWAMYVAVAIHVACAIDAGVRLRGVQRDAEDKNWPLYASLVGVVGFLYFQLATERYGIPAPSMLPAITVGDTVYIETVSTHWSAPRRGEVIVFDHPCEHRAHIKRVIAIAKDTVETRCGNLYVNGKLIAYDTLPDGHDKDFPSLDRIQRSCPGKTNQATGKLVETKATGERCDLQLHYVVPPESLFVMGDNRAASNDSRNWGALPVGNVTGRAIGIAWPLAHARGL